MTEIKLVYQQIKDYIRNEAENRKPGETLNSEVYYSKIFGVSRPTVRKAVDELISEGIIARIAGKGLFLAGNEDSSRNPERKMAIIVPFSPGDGFMYDLIAGCVDTLNNTGWSYSVFNYQTDEEKLNAYRQVQSGGYSGIVLAAYDKEVDIKFIKSVKKRKVPLVLVDNLLGQVDIPCVISDDFRGAYSATEYLIKNGHQKILHLSLDKDTYTVKLRREGFLKALEDYKIELSPEYIVRLESDKQVGQLLLAIKFEYTAIFGYSDIPVIYAYNLLADKNVKIPSDLSLLGYGDFAFSKMLKTPLTTVSIPVYRMGSEAAGMILKHVQEGAELGKIMLDTKLIERESIAALRR